jgi:hypothetical protein
MSGLLELARLVRGLFAGLVAAHDVLRVVLGRSDLVALDASRRGLLAHHFANTVPARRLSRHLVSGLEFLCHAIASEQPGGRLELGLKRAAAGRHLRSGQRHPAT